MANSDPIVIVGAARTPMGGFQGELKDVTAPALGSVAIRSVLDRTGADPADVDEVVMGCVLPAGQGQAPARQASIGAGIPEAARREHACGEGAVVNGIAVWCKQRTAAVLQPCATFSVGTQAV